MAGTLRFKHRNKRRTPGGRGSCRRCCRRPMSGRRSLRRYGHGARRSRRMSRADWRSGSRLPLGTCGVHGSMRPIVHRGRGESRGSVSPLVGACRRSPGVLVHPEGIVISGSQRFRTPAAEAAGLEPHSTRAAPVAARIIGFGPTRIFLLAVFFYCLILAIADGRGLVRVPVVRPAVRAARAKRCVARGPGRPRGPSPGALGGPALLPRHPGGSGTGARNDHNRPATTHAVG